ncbi:UNKNOWN [Stylonychia lemnae]|uniref:Protein kinase domain-containing protein n=1 Tax=Stylonychia lemnae TaxID=5949 RepID=A0A078A7W5_STYLE|nr:UNKNOWN [Stylonychia lemnae]|eukprot:CDW78355.1 UNKNOWN [Stylonychia lemnae]
MATQKNQTQINPPDNLQEKVILKTILQNLNGKPVNIQKLYLDSCFKGGNGVQSLEQIYAENYCQNDENRLMLVTQAINLLEQFHKQAFYVHRNVNPDSFKGKDGQLFLVDFSKSKNIQELVISNIQQVSNITSNPMTISVHVHNQLHSLQGDDIISCLYSMLILFERQGLTWYVLNRVIILKYIYQNQTSV